MTKKALLIGINRSRIPGADLRGCVNDVKNLQSVLTQSCGFNKADMTVLTDFKATKKAMQSAIHKLVAGALSGDVRVLHYSGHGSNGALTYHLVKVIQQAGGKLTYRELHERVLKLLQGGRYDQVPQLEGRKNRFDQPFLAPLR